MRSEVGSGNETVRSDRAGLGKRVGISLVACEDLRFLTVEEFKDLEPKVFEIQRMLASLSQRLGASVLARS
jgi:hypothetical protein